MNILKRLIPKKIYHSQRMYNFCKNYLDHHHGQNNCNISTNGELRVMKTLLPQCKTVFDVGANIGEWTKLALQINPSLTIHCFEPSHATYKTLIANTFAPNKFVPNKFVPKTIYNNVGLSSQNKTEKLYLFDDGSPLNTLYQRQGLESVGLTSPATSETIKLITLDDYCQEKKVDHIDFLKIDVEGHELEVFMGAKKMLMNKSIKTIQFEYGGCNIDSRVFLRDIFDFFESLPYDLYKIYPEKIELVKTYSQVLDNFQLQNWLALAT